MSQYKAHINALFFMTAFPQSYLNYILDRIGNPNLTCDQR